MLTTSGFSSTTTSKVGQIRRMPSCRWEGTATTVKRRGCKLKLRARLATGTVPVSAAKHSETLPNIKISKRFSGESAWSDSRKVPGRAKRRKRCFAPICAVPLVPALGLASIYRENALHPYPFTEALSRSTLLQPFACRSQPTLRSASHGSARPPAADWQCRRPPATSSHHDPGARADVARPPAATTPEPAPTSPDLQPP
jgi:hypothetical protein